MSERLSDHGLRLVVQSVLYETGSGAVERMLIAVDRAAAYLLHRRPGSQVSVVLGDCSPTAMLADDSLEILRARTSAVGISYRHFGANLGHAAAQNTLFAEHDADYTLMVNPDVVLAADALRQLIAVIDGDPTIAIVDGKQLPLEHPKRYDATTGDTSWCSGALSMVRSAAFREVGGYDSTAFFMHGDDVDLSWRLRHAGWRAVHHPGAVGFHDRRLGEKATMLPSPLERRHSAECALTLAYLWGATERLETLRRTAMSDGDDVEREALAAFEAKRLNGALRSPAARQPPVASFIGPTYGGHRW